MPDTPAVLRTVVASDNFLTREGLACLLQGVESIEVVARVDSHPETLDAVRQYRADVLVVGIRTPRVAAEASLSAAQKLRAEHPDTRRGRDRRSRRRLCARAPALRRRPHRVPARRPCR